MLNIGVLDAILVVVVVWLVYKLYQLRLRSVKISDIDGPPSLNWLHGASEEIYANGSAATFEKWEKAYGSIFRVPFAVGSSHIVIFDTKALSHIFSRDAAAYVHPTIMKKEIARFFGKGLMWSEGEDHRRQRKILNPLFNTSSIRFAVPAFYNSALKISAAWESLILQSSSEDAIIDISRWMNGFSLDNIGLAIFGYNFGTLDGKGQEIPRIIDSLGRTRPTKFETFITRLSNSIPILHNVPTTRSRIIERLHDCLSGVANALLCESDDTGDKSLISTLLKAEENNKMTQSEVLAQMRVLLQAGYETTAIGLTFALIDLAKNAEAQIKLRSELLSLPPGEPGHDLILSSDALPYLSAVTQESLRLHSPVGQIVRVAAQDEVLPLRSPLRARSGKILKSIIIPKGTTVNIPLRSINLSTAFWGPNAKEFVPERWLDNEKGIPLRAKEIQGYHHTLTFMDGPRMCLGRNIAVTEMKTALAILVRNFTFEMRDGPDTKVETVISLFARPKVVGEQGYAMPLRIRKFDS